MTLSSVGVVLPWLVTMFCYQASMLIQICNWMALLTIGVVNLVVPLSLYRQVRGLSSPGLSSPGLSSPAGRRRPPQLRNALGPYIYTAAFEAHESGVLPCHPLYYSFPEEPEAYALSSLRGPSQPLQHSFGESFVVSPITQGTSVRSLIFMRFWTELLRFLYVFVHCMFGSNFAVRR